MNTANALARLGAPVFAEERVFEKTKGGDRMGRYKLITMLFIAFSLNATAGKPEETFFYDPNELKLDYIVEAGQVGWERGTGSQAFTKLPKMGPIWKDLLIRYRGRIIYRGTHWWTNSQQRKLQGDALLEKAIAHGRMVTIDKYGRLEISTRLIPGEPHASGSNSEAKSVIAEETHQE
jgi:hypothetical protein